MYLYLKDIIDWFFQNKEWVFSGIGLSVAAVLFAGIRSLFSKRKKEKEQKTIIQVNYGTKGTQIGIQNNYYKKEENDE